jgi:formylmethanofuran dehydrogenase subunit A
MSSELKIVNGRVYDPANNIDGKVQDILIRDGKIVNSVSSSATKIDAHGMVVMPGAVDIHCHIAGAKVNLARKLQPEDHRLDVHPKTAHTRSGTGGVVPSTFATGYRYATMGYTTAMEAAVPPITARHTLEELDDTPVIDKGFYVLLGNNAFLYKLLKEGRKKEFKEAIAWWIDSVHAYALKLVNVGSDELWKGRKNANITNVNDNIDHYDITPTHVIESFIEAAHELGLPHPPHIHCNNLGHSGNISTTLDTMKAAQGRRVHMAHIQFHSFGGEAHKNAISGVRSIIDYINDNDNITTDVGQVMFGKATAMTADAPLAWMLRNVKMNKWVNADTECESGCGIIPFSYQDHIYTHALQWAMGLELFLHSKDPWRVLLSTDHPNGGSFMSYPKLIKLLMDSDYRKEALSHVNQKAIDKTSLRELDREYTLYEIAIITRAGPARALGLTNKGQLGIGADADITIYTEEEDKEEMFNAPRYVIKDGVTVIKDHEFATDHKGKLLHTKPGYNEDISKEIEPFFEDYYSVKFNNYAISDDYLHKHEVIPTTPKA